MTEVCGIDSGSFKRGGVTTPEFKAAWGVAVTFSNHEELEEKYNETLDKLFDKYGKKRLKRVYSSFRIHKLFNDPLTSYKFLDELFQGISSIIKELDITYSYFPDPGLTSIMIYDRKGSRTPPLPIKPIEFIEKHLLHYYPHLCAHQFLFVRNLLGAQYSGHLCLDGFEGKVTSAWLSIRNQKNLFVFPRGDEYNFAISVADTTLTTTNNRLYQTKTGLVPEQLTNALPEVPPENIRINFLSEKAVPYIKPLYDTAINLDEYVKHPIVFIIRDEKSPLKSRFIDRSPVIDAVYNFACIEGCSVKSFDQERDQGRIQKGDYFVYLGPREKELVETIKNVGYDIIAMSAQEMVKHYYEKLKTF